MTTMIQYPSEFVSRSAAARGLTAFTVLMIVLAAPVSGQDDAPAACQEDASTEQRAERLFDLFHEDAAALEFIQQKTGEKYLLVEQPLLRFSTEGTVFGAVYVWHDASSRLAVMGTIGSLPIRGTPTQFVELHLLKPEPISPVVIRGFPDKRWQPNVEELVFKSFNKAPSVAASDRLRLTQMRNLARQFSAEMLHNGQTNQLRLLPQPLYRYPDSSKERDGALFAFVWDNGTDPELVLRIESSDQSGQLMWEYQPIRLTWRELSLQHEGRRIWHVDEFVERNATDQRTPYITGLTKPVP